MVDLSSSLPDEDLRLRYGTPTLDRAWDYVRRGKVLACTHELDGDGDLDIRGSVSGSTGVPYVVTISVGLDERGVWVFGRCSCPVHEGCKHVLALLITVRDEQSRDSPDARRRWERQLSGLLDELDVRAERTALPGKPLALQVDLKPPQRAGTFRGWSATPAARGVLRLRPLQRGARDNWVRTGIAWTDVPQLDRRGHPPAQVAALNDLLAAHRTASRQLYFGADAHISLGGFGPGEVALLRQAADSGMPLVPGRGPVGRRPGRPGHAAARRERPGRGGRPAPARRATRAGVVPRGRPRRARRRWSRGRALDGGRRRLGGDAGGAHPARRPRGAPAAAAGRLGRGARRRP